MVLRYGRQITEIDNQTGRAETGESQGQHAEEEFRGGCKARYEDEEVGSADQLE
jgi:hypothetical protein